MLEGISILILHDTSRFYICGLYSSHILFHPMLKCYLIMNETPFLKRYFESMALEEMGALHLSLATLVFNVTQAAVLDT